MSLFINCAAQKLKNISNEPFVSHPTNYLQVWVPALIEIFIEIDRLTLTIHKGLECPKTKNALALTFHRNKFSRKAHKLSKQNIPMLFQMSRLSVVQQFICMSGFQH